MLLEDMGYNWHICYQVAFSDVLIPDELSRWSLTDSEQDPRICCPERSELLFDASPRCYYERH